MWHSLSNLSSEDSSDISKSILNSKYIRRFDISDKVVRQTGGRKKLFGNPKSGSKHGSAL